MEKLCPRRPIREIILIKETDVRKNISRRILIGAWILLILTTACNLPSATTPAPVGTIFPDGQVTPTTLPTDTLNNNATPEVSIPVTGMGDVTLQCQFCVNAEPHAVLVIPEVASFNVNVSDPSTRITCLTTQIINGRRVLLCRGAQQSSFNLDVCVGGSNCLQFPITLEVCTLDPQDSIGGTPQVMQFAPLTPIVQAPIDTPIPPTSPANTSTPLPAQPIQPTPSIQPTQVVVNPPHLQPTRPTTPSLTPQPQQPAIGLQDPGEFARWYFGAVWQERNYQDLWDNYLTQSFKTNVGSGSYEDYVTWWGSVERIDVHSVNVMRNDGSYAWVRVNVTFYMKDGRTISNQEYDYDLFYDASRGTWMFDYRI